MVQRVHQITEVSVCFADARLQTLSFSATQACDYGMLRLYVNGKLAGPKIDFYAEDPTSSGTVELGSFEPVDGAYILRVEVLDSGPKSTGVLFGVDCVNFNEAE